MTNIDIKAKALALHSRFPGKLGTEIKIKMEDRNDLNLAYTPGVAEPCREIYRDEKNVYKYTMKANTVAVITNGTAVLGLGNIGAKASIPVMEGKAILFKKFAGIDSFPIIVDSQDPQEVIEIVAKISANFGAINLEDIKAPECFQIEDELKKRLDIPVFHDDQQGTAIVVSAGLINALKVVKKTMNNINVVIVGPGAAGIAITKMLLKLKVHNIVLVGPNGALTKEHNWENEAQRQIAQITNLHQETGSLAQVLKNKDVVIGVSRPNLITKEMIATMNQDAIVFSLANPVPEIMPLEAKAGGARIVATGRSDFPNQVNNVLAFPGVFRGALDVGATQISEDMKLEAIKALAGIIPDHQLNENNILPSLFESSIVPTIAKAVALQAIKSRLVRK